MLFVHCICFVYFKAYLRALTTPQETLAMSYPPGAQEMLMDPPTHIKIEHQSKAAILFMEGQELLVQGDTLSVTLAVSAIEDFLNTNFPEEQSACPSTSKDLST